MKKNLITLTVAIASLLFVGLACGGASTPTKPAPPEYVGAWTGADGATMTIRADGGADYKSGNGSMTVSGGGFEMSEDGKSFKLAFMGMGPSFRIDKAPSGDQMTLDGIVFKRSGGGSSSSPEAKAEVPNNDKLQSLVKTTFLDFGDAVQSGDFGDFHNKTAKVWRDSSSTEELNKAFKPFIDHKENYNFKKAISPLDATFEPAPAIDKVSNIDALIVKGYYPTKPDRTNFELKYAMDDGVWKLIGINIKTSGE